MCGALRRREAAPRACVAAKNEKKKYARARSASGDWMRSGEKQLAKEIKMRPGGLVACRGVCCLCLRKSKFRALDFNDNFLADGEILREGAGCAARGDENGKKMSVQECGKVVIKTRTV